MLGLVTRQEIDHVRRRWHGRLQHEVVAVDPDLDAGSPRCRHGFRSAHSLALQPDFPVFPGADWDEKIASAPSAEVAPLDFEGLARTVGAEHPSALLAAVRGGAAAEPLVGLDFGIGADDADGADGCARRFLARQKAGLW